MKKNDIKDLNTKTEDELKKLLVGLRQELSKMKVDLSQGKVKNVGRFRELRKDIARVMTIISVQRFAKKIASQTKKKGEK